MADPGALDGVRVIDAGQIIAGPFAATILGEFGAEVIKVEQPGIGDASRGAGGMAAEFAQNSRNKRSITLDLRRPEGQRLFKHLVMVSDVVVENFLPGTMERWHLGYEDLAAINPGIVMLRSSGYGQTGPYKHRYSFDRIALAFAGLTHLTGMPDHPPVRPGYFIADYSTGFLGAFGVLAALRHRDGPGKGRGQVVDVSLYETIWRMSGILPTTLPQPERCAIAWGTRSPVSHRRNSSKRPTANISLSMPAAIGRSSGSAARWVMPNSRRIQGLPDAGAGSSIWMNFISA